ncbi:MAG: thioredoxin domain-containing protein, partial [Candidatus Lokiarchaeota archaeon]
AENIKNSALGFTYFLSAIDFVLGPTFSLVISGDTNKDDTKFLLDIIRNNYLPNKALLFRPTDIDSPKVDELSNFITYFDKYEGKATAYVCINKTCKPPTNDAKKMVEYLNPKR